MKYRYDTFKTPCCEYELMLVAGLEACPPYRYVHVPCLFCSEKYTVIVQCELSGELQIKLAPPLDRPDMIFTVLHNV